MEITLTHTQLAVLAAVHRADEEEGGLATDTLDADERDALAVLSGLGLVEILVIDSEDALTGTSARISARGVEMLRDAGLR